MMYSWIIANVFSSEIYTHIQVQKKVSDKRDQNNLKMSGYNCIFQHTNHPNGHLLPLFCGTTPLFMWCDCRRWPFSFQKLSSKEPLVILVPKAFVFWNFLEICQHSTPKISCLGRMKVFKEAWFNKHKTTKYSLLCGVTLTQLFGDSTLAAHVVGVFLRVKTNLATGIFLASECSANFST